LVSAILIYFGFSYFVPLIVALLGCGMGYWVLTNTFDVKTSSRLSS
jgi:hypothetical protein